MLLLYCPEIVLFAVLVFCKGCVCCETSIKQHRICQDEHSNFNLHSICTKDKVDLQITLNSSHDDADSLEQYNYDFYNLEYNCSSENLFEMPRENNVIYEAVEDDDGWMWNHVGNINAAIQEKITCSFKGCIHRNVKDGCWELISGDSCTINQHAPTSSLLTLSPVGTTSPGVQPTTDPTGLSHFSSASTATLSSSMSTIGFTDQTKSSFTSSSSRTNEDTSIGFTDQSTSSFISSSSRTTTASSLSTQVARRDDSSATLTFIWYVGLAGFLSMFFGVLAAVCLLRLRKKRIVNKFLEKNGKLSRSITDFSATNLYDINAAVSPCAIAKAHDVYGSFSTVYEQLETIPSRGYRTYKLPLQKHIHTYEEILLMQQQIADDKTKDNFDQIVIQSLSSSLSEGLHQLPAGKHKSIPTNAADTFYPQGPPQFDSDQIDQYIRTATVTKELMRNDDYVSPVAEKDEQHSTNQISGIESVLVWHDDYMCNNVSTQNPVITATTGQHQSFCSSDPEQYFYASTTDSTGSYVTTAGMPSAGGYIPIDAKTTENFEKAVLNDDDDSMISISFCNSPDLSKNIQGDYLPHTDASDEFSTTLVTDDEFSIDFPIETTI